MSKITIKPSKITLKAGTERTFVVTWTVTGSQKNHVDQFEWKWLYKRSGAKGWIVGSDGTTDGGSASQTKEATYDVPTDAVSVDFQIRATSKTHKVKTTKTVKGKKKEVEETKHYFSTTKWGSAGVASVKVDKLVKKGYYSLSKNYTYNASSSYPLSVDVTPHLSTAPDKKNFSWVTNFEVTWEFYVNEGGRKLWRTGDATSSIPRDTTTVVYTGVIPNSFEKLRVVTKPTSADSSVVAQNVEKQYDSSLTKTIRQAIADSIHIFRYPHGDNTVMAEWRLTPSDANLDGFTCKFETLTEGNGSGSGARWTNETTMDIDPDQWMMGSIYVETPEYATRAWSKEVEKTVEKHGTYVPTKAEKFAQKVINKKDPITYLIKHGKAKNKIEATVLYNKYMETVATLRDKQAKAYAKVTTGTVTEVQTGTERYQTGTKNVETPSKFYYSEEYTIPEGASEIRVTITPKSAETSGYLETSVTSEPYKVVIDTKQVAQSSIRFTLIPNTRRSFVAQWNKIEDPNVASYEYEWGYRIAGLNMEFWGADTGTLSQDAPAFHTPIYEAPENAQAVLFRVKPVPKHTNDFLGVYCSPATEVIMPLPKRSIPNNLIRVVWPEAERTDKTLTAAWSLHLWDPDTKKQTDDLVGKVAGYEVVWRYVIYTKELGTLIREGETQSINDKQVISDDYTVPANAKHAQFRVRPVPNNEDLDFEGIWSEWVDYLFSVPSRTINSGSLNVIYSEGTDRKLKVSFTISNESHVKDYTYSYQTYVRGVLSEPTEGTVTQKIFEIDAPTDADEIRLKIKPNDTSGSNAYFVSTYSSEFIYSLKPGTRSVQDIAMFLQRGSKTTVVATWGIDDERNVDSYSFKWRYKIDAVWYDGSSGTTSYESKVCTYDAPAQADMVEVKVTPVPKYSLAFEGKDSEYEIFIMPSSTVPETPAVPSLSINKFRLTAMVDSYDEKASMIEYEFINDVDTDDTFYGNAEILFNRATYVQDIEAGYGIRARARALNDDGEASDWSEYTTDPVYTIPLPPEGVPVVNALSATSVEVLWNQVDGATSYVIQRTTKARYFDAAPDLVEETTITSGIRAEIQGLEPKSETDGNTGEWYFRIKAVNDASGESEWSEIAYIVLGTVPDAPTTWSSSTTPVTSDDVYLNWLHNSEDGSAQSGAIIEMTVNGVKETHEIVDEYELFEPYLCETTVEIKKSFYVIRLGEYEEYTTRTIDLTDIVPEDLRHNISVASLAIADAEDAETYEQIVGEGEFSLNGSEISFKYPTGSSTSEVVWGNAFLIIQLIGVENTIDVSSVPAILKPDGYVGITKLGDNDEYTSKIVSSRIEDNTVYFVLDIPTDSTGFYTTATLSFYKDDVIITEPTEMIYSSETVTIESEPQTIDNYSGTQFISVDISEIPKNQRNGLLAELYSTYNPTRRTVLKNETPYTWSYTKTLNKTRHWNLMIGDYQKYKNKTVDLSNVSGLSDVLDDYNKIYKVEMGQTRSGWTIGEYETDSSIEGECDFSINNNILTYQYPQGTDPNPSGPHLTSSDHYLWLTWKDESSSKIELDGTMLPDGIRDIEHNMKLSVTDAEGNSADDKITSWSFENDVMTINYKNSDDDSLLNCTVSVTANTDNYEINGDMLIHYVYKVSNLDAAPIALEHILSVSKDDIYHRSLANNFSFQRGGVSYYLIPAGTYEAGAVITWKVKTKGVLPDYGPFSGERQINIYTPPTIRVTIGSGYRWLSDDFEFREDNIYTNGSITASSIEGRLETFPMILDIHSGPTTQKPLVYVLSIISNDTYDDIDDTGRIIHIRSGQEIYKRYIYTNERDFITLIMANELNLDNLRSYTLTVTVNTDVGLTAETTSDFVVDWDMDADVELDASLTIDEDAAVVYLNPSATNEQGYYLNHFSLSVFRREFDGGLTEIATDLANGDNITVIDPHPALDYARYRIVAIDTSTGRMFYEDLAPQPIGITDIIIQWDESWSGFDTDDFPSNLDEAPYKGSMLRLPYNIDESESNDLDIELVNYIGRKHPVSYFGTHVGQTASWKTDIAKTDKETIYALRRLAVWPGDCYVRSPSGVGYWAHVKVSFDISHLEPIVPVSLDITRVEGGT